jgi:hypothetical protein
MPDPNTQILGLKGQTLSYFARLLTKTFFNLAGTGQCYKTFFLS